MIINFKKEETIPPEQNPTEKLVRMITKTCLISLDKTLRAIRNSRQSYAAAGVRVGSIAERITRASYEVGMTLPLEKRASYDPYKNKIG